ncbi:helix-turn-helix domain-containing protein [Nodosilinea nodulosa]|uniref:helix-turn-helix domain-containing protein n=1 Tax=Nodosilinea nodulosa TaxID=416001 RepID=UPI0002ED6070|nr:helix-turn-helix domain-containing protein [Nodosilinea nodulosa]
MANLGTEPVDYSPTLRSLMAQAGIASYRSLSQRSGVPRSAIDGLRQGQIGRLRVVALQRLSQTLNVPLDALVEMFSGLAASPGDRAGADTTDQIKALRQECDRLQTQLATQAEAVRQQVQQAAIAQLEPWLVQWPTAVHAAQQKPDLPAQKLIPLVRPVEALVQHWGITPIEAVGVEVSFDPKIHQPKAGMLSSGQRVRVSHVGYRQGDRLLYRAKVSAI